MNDPSEHQVKKGNVAITVDVHGSNPFTVEIPLATVTEELDKLEKQMGIAKLHRTSLKKHVQIRAMVAAGRPIIQDRALIGVGLTCLWLAVHYPLPTQRAHVMRLLREEDAVHITVMMNGEKFAIAAGPSFIDLEQLTENVSPPPGSALYYVNDENDGLATLN